MDFAGKVSEITGMRGADICFEAVGISDTVRLAVNSVRKGGRVVLVGNISGNVEFPLQTVVTKEIRVQGSCAIRGEYEQVLEMLSSGRISVDDQISVVAPLSEGAAWFNRLYNKEGGLSKVILKP